MASRIFSNEGYFPVPTIRRDLYSLPPSQSDVSYMMWSSLSASAHRADDLDLVTFAERGRRVGRLGSDLAIERHRGELARHREADQQVLDREPLGQLHRLAVDGDDHKKTAPLVGAAPMVLRTARSLRWNYPVQVRGVPGRTRFSGNLPPRRRFGVYTLELAPERLRRRHRRLADIAAADIRGGPAAHRPALGEQRQAFDRRALGRAGHHAIGQISGEHLVEQWLGRRVPARGPHDGHLGHGTHVEVERRE